MNACNEKFTQWFTRVNGSLEGNNIHSVVGQGSKHLDLRMISVEKIGGVKFP